ncbi:MAG: hypothetical protein PHE47_01225 [Oscillospiraceae bacterium]|nr:hypothetical protein [Oscillospiraceae bacterium]
MKCQVCGTEFEGKFCTNCGTSAGQNQVSVQNHTPIQKGMTCRKCGSANISVQVINEVKLKNQHHGIIWWLCIGWWWLFFKWMFLTLPALIFKIFGHKKQKVINKQKTICVCQNCGNKWNA